MELDGKAAGRSSSICVSQVDRGLNCTLISAPQSVKLSSFSLAPFPQPPPPSLHFSARLHKHIQCTDTSTRAHTGTSVSRLHCPTQASFIPWSGKQLEHRRCSTWVGSEGPFGEDFFGLVFTVLIPKHFQDRGRLKLRPSYVELRFSYK